MEQIQKWINTIVVTVIFVTFVDILMPNNSMKKYLKMILGFLIMAIMLQPLLSFLDKDYSLSAYTFDYALQMEGDYLKKQSENYTASQQEAVSKLYKEKLENEFTNQIRKIEGNRNVNVSVDIVDDLNSKDFGNINKIVVMLGKEIKVVDKVEKIEVSGSKNNKSNNNQDIDETGEEDLRNKIASLYGIDKNIIEIKYEE